MSCTTSLFVRLIFLVARRDLVENIDKLQSGGRKGFENYGLPTQAKGEQGVKTVLTHGVSIFCNFMRTFFFGRPLRKRAIKLNDFIHVMHVIRCLEKSVRPFTSFIFE